MNIFAQHCLLLLLLAMLFESIEMDEIYKFIRPYKYYQRRPPRRPRLYKGHKSFGFHRFRRIPPDDYYSRRPRYYRYRSAKEDPIGGAETQPCTIVIQLPRGESRHGDDNYRYRKRIYERDRIPTYVNENDYIDEDEETVSKVVDTNNKRVQIKMIKGRSPKLAIKISKSDNEKGIEIVDKSSITGTDLSSLPTMYTNWTMSMQQ